MPSSAVRPSPTVSPRAVVVLSLALGLGPVGGVADAQPRRSNGSSRAQSSTPSPRVSTADLDAFGRRVVALFDDPAGAAADPMFTDDGILERAVEGLDVPAAVRAQLLAGAREGSASSGGLVRRLLVRAEADDTILYRGPGVRDGLPVARFRVLRATGAFHFLEFALVPRPNGMGIVDVWQTGQWVSRFIRASSLSLLPAFGPEASPSDPGRTADERLARLRRIASIIDHAAADDLDGVFRAYDECDAETRRDELVLLVVLAALTRHSDHPRYVEMLDVFARTFPDSAWSAMLDIGRFGLRGDHAHQADAIQRLLRSVGEDGYLRCLLASARSQQGELAMAIAEAERAVALEPTLPDAHVVRAEVAAQMGRFDRVTASVEALAEMELEPPGLHDQPLYEAYRHTPDYRRLYP